MPDRNAAIPLPSHAYVPGLNQRHDERWFDRVKGSAQPGMTPDALTQCRAFKTGLAYLDAGYFWECHEVLEAVWLALPDGTPERTMVQAIIQLANARLKLRMHRPRATLRLCDIVEALLNGWEDANLVLGVQAGDLRAQVQQARNAANDEI